MHAQAYLDMSESEQRQWRKDHPLVTEAVEVMGALSDGSVKGHLGYFFDSKASSSEAILSRLTDEVLAPLRGVCESCLRGTVPDMSSCSMT